MQLAGERRAGGSPPHLLAGILGRELDPLQTRVGFPDLPAPLSRAIPGILWQRRSPVFVLCLQCLLTTASPLQLLLLAFMCALAGEMLQPKRKLGKFSAEQLVPARVSEPLWFECGFLNPFPSRRFGRCSSLHLWEVNTIYWGWIVRSWSVPLAWNCSEVLGVLLRCRCEPYAPEIWAVSHTH